MEENDLLYKIKSPKDLKELNYSSLSSLCNSIREVIISSVTKNGGHLASNLGIVELTVALHYVFDAPEDKIIFDVGHQIYTHKILTGRLEGFKNLRRDGGITGFPSKDESEFDTVTSGHSSTSLSLALGICRASVLENKQRQVVAVIGDGALTGGMAFEALNDIGASKANVTIVLNDNKMSISKNVGAMSEYFSKLRLSKTYSRFKRSIKRAVTAMPFFGDDIAKLFTRVKNAIRPVFQRNKMFENMGIKYLGPIDGHDIKNLTEIFNSAKREKGPVLIHVITDKGKGHDGAICDPELYHGVAPEEKDYQKPFASCVSETLLEIAENNKKIVAVTAAMPSGTGLVAFSKKFPERYFDVGIAEQHAVTMSAGLAAGGLKPYFAVYSSFLQRAYDQIIHDVCINNLPVTFLIDRAGVIGSDGITHQGLYDIGFLSQIPSMTVLSPKDGAELKKMLEWSAGFNAPLAIRYPKSYKTDFLICEEIKYGKFEEIRKCPKTNQNNNKNVYIICVGGRMLDIARDVKNAAVINARFIKPLDTEFLNSINKENNLIITLEDGYIKGGFGEGVLNYINSTGKKAEVLPLGFNDNFIKTLSLGKAYKENNLTAEYIETKIQRF